MLIFSNLRQPWMSSDLKQINESFLLVHSIQHFQTDISDCTSSWWWIFIRSFFFLPQLPQDNLANETLRSSLLYQQPQSLIHSPLQAEMDCDINNPLQVGAFSILTLYVFGRKRGGKGKWAGTCGILRPESPEWICASIPYLVHTLV